MTGLEILITLLTGWLSFMLRVFPDVSIRWDGVAMGSVALFVALLCGRSFLNWLSREWSNSDSTVAAKWSWHATGALLVLVLLVFVIGISLVGITHQTIWLATSPEPWWQTPKQSAADSARSVYQPGTVDPHQPAGNWITAIMPFTMFMLDPTGDDSLREDLPWNSPENAPLFRRPMPLLINPSLEVPNQSPDGFGLSHFAGNAHVFGGDPKSLQDFDTAGTMLAVEVNVGFVPWGHPDNCRDLAHGLRNDWIRTPKSQPLGFGPVGDRETVMMVMVDGSTREVSVEADAGVLRQMDGAKPKSP
jgi:hypothetical protein